MRVSENMKKTVFAVVIAVCTAVVIWIAAGQQDGADGADAQEATLFRLHIGNAAVNVEVVDTPQTRARGLMHREFLPEDQGMLFIFAREDVYCFWMKNTLIPLDIAFIDANWNIIDIQSMRPHSEELVCPPGNVLYALEVNEGWFARRGIASVSRVGLSEELKKRIQQNTP